MTQHLTQAIFEVRNLIKKFDRDLIVNITDLVIRQEKIYCLYGPNGAGKTTLFELLTLLKIPTKGTIRFCGKEIYPQENGLTELRSQVTFVQQDPLLFDTTVERNVDYGLRIRKVDKDTRKSRVKECLQLVGLDGFQKRKARQLSGGETQRIAIARALSIRPTVLFLDEFSANVDEEHRAVLENIIHKIRAQFGTTIVFTTHYLEQAYRIADEVIHLFRGHLVNAPLRNILHGKIERQREHCRFFTEYVSFDVLACQEGHATVAISPTAIVISTHPIESSMRNHLHGSITHIIDAGNHVDLKVMAGEHFDVTISKESYHEMMLYPGMQVFLNFKATAVEVF